MVSKKLGSAIISYAKKKSIDTKQLLQRYSVKMLGPELTDDEASVTGINGTTEQFQFSANANDVQKKFHAFLMSNNQDLASEYMFYIIKATEFWKHKLTILKVIKESLSVEEKHLEKDLGTLSQKMTSNHEHVHAVLKTYLPKVFQRINVSEISLAQNLATIRLAYKEIHGEEDMLNTVISSIEEEFPFLKD